MTSTLTLDITVLAAAITGPVLTPGHRRLRRRGRRVQRRPPARAGRRRRGHRRRRRLRRGPLGRPSRASGQRPGHRPRTDRRPGRHRADHHPAAHRPRIDPEARTARVGAGVRWRAVIDAAAPYGLAPLNGSSSSVGVVGYTLGGGIGPMARRYGFAADHVRSFTIVTADGEIRTVDEQHHATCSGPCAAARSASGWSPRSPSSWFRSPGSSAAASSSPATTRPMCCTPGAHGPRRFRTRPPHPLRCCAFRRTRSCRRRCRANSSRTCGTPTSATRQTAERAARADAGRGADPDRHHRRNALCRSRCRAHGPDDADAVLRPRADPRLVPGRGGRGPGGDLRRRLGIERHAGRGQAARWQLCPRPPPHPTRLPAAGPPSRSTSSASRRGRRPR